MRKLALAAVLIGNALATGCKQPGSQKLEGHWRGQKADGVSESAQSSANAFATSTEIIAQGNQISIHTVGSRPPPPAAYTVDKEDATTLVIHTDRDRTTETFAFDPKAGTMVWKIDAQRSITFKKVP